MQGRNGFKMVLLLLAVVCLFQNTCQAQFVEVLYDNFDDGNYDGWSVFNYISSEAIQPPPMVPSPEGYAVGGLGGYGSLICVISQPIDLQDATEICIEVRAKSARRMPCHPTVFLGNGYIYTSNAYYVRDYGEYRPEAQWFWFTHPEPGQPQIEEGYWIYPAGGIPYDWHTFKWCRDADGWWSLEIYADDGSPPVVAIANFAQDLQITSFEWVQIVCFGDQSAVEWVRISAASQEIAVNVDIKPDSCPNPLNVKDKGVLPVAILGSAELDVSTIDVASICLAGVDPVRSSYEDVSSPAPDTEDECECTTEGPDGYLDLTLKFNAQDIVEALGEVNDGDELQLTLIGALAEVFGGTPIEGQDCVVIIKKGKK